VLIFAAGTDGRIAGELLEQFQIIIGQVFPTWLWRSLGGENPLQGLERIGVIANSSFQGRQQILTAVVTLQRQHGFGLGTRVSLLGEQAFQEPRTGLAPLSESLTQPLGFDTLTSRR